MSAASGVTTHLVVRGAASASTWYQAAFGAEERTRVTLPDGRLIHVEMAIGPARFMLADEFPEHGAFAPAADAPTPMAFYLHVDDVEAAWPRAVAAGAVVIRPLSDVFWGEREGQLRDPFGYRWGLTQKLREVGVDELAAAAQAMFAQ